MIPNNLDLFKEMLEACKDTIDNCKDELANMFNKGNRNLDITFQFRPGEVVIMNVNSDYLVRKNTINETKIIDIKERRNENVSKSSI